MEGLSVREVVKGAGGTMPGRKRFLSRGVWFGLCLFAALTVPPALGQEGRPDSDQEGTRTESETLPSDRKGGPRVFITPVVGWGETRNAARFHYLIPLYYHQRKVLEDERLTAAIPLLSGYYRGNIREDIRLDGVASLPLLALMGSVQGRNRYAEGYLSPYLAAGTIGWNGSQSSAQSSGASLFPWIPLIGDLLTFHLYASARYGNQRGSYGYRTALAFPSLGLAGYEHRAAGIEKDIKVFSLWDFTLYRKTLDLPGAGFSPNRHEFDTTRLTRHLNPLKAPREGQEEIRAFADLAAALEASRSGNPVERTALLDPMLVYARRGEAIQAVGFEPLFYFDEREGISLPLLFTTFREGRPRFFGDALKHLFPLLHGNPEGTRYDFLANVGTVHRMRDYTAVDLKFLFNYQRDEKRGVVWGFLPFFAGRTPRDELREDVRFVQFSGHAVSYWNVTDRCGFEMLPPLFLTWEKEVHGDGASSGEQARSSEEFCLGPFNLLFYYKREPRGELEHSALGTLLYAYESGPEEEQIPTRYGRKFTLGPFHMLFNYEQEPDGDVEHSALWSILYAYEREALGDRGVGGTEGSLSVGPFGILFNYDWRTGRDRKMRFLLAFGLESTEDAFEINIFGLPIFKVH